jgi:anaerobic selenocysteine-containing dehydrogenase
MSGIPAGGFLSNTPRDWCASRVILLAGGDLAWDDPVTFGPLQDARDRGARLYYLGSRGGVTSRRATEAWIVRPGTEALALAAVLHVLMRDGLVCRDVIERDAAGFEDLARKAGAYAPADVAGCCGLPADRLAALARRVAEACPMHVVTGQVGARRRIGDDVLSLSLALCVIRGSLGRSGGGFNVLGADPFCGTDAPAACLERELEERRPSAFLAYGDPLSDLAGKAARDALRNAGCVIHVGPFDNETRRIALVSLPSSHWMEYDCLAACSNGRALQWSRAAAAPFGESRGPYALLSSLAELLDPAGSGRRGAPADERSLADAMLARCPLTAGMRVSDLDSEEPGGMLWPCTAEDHDGPGLYEKTRYVRGNVRGRNNILFTPYSTWTGSDRKFPTADGLIHL